MTPLDAYELSTDRERVDAAAVWRFLATGAYWGRWRSEDDFRAQLAGAWRVVGCYDRRTGETVGFARAVSDGVAFAYLADVFVLPEHRGRGLGARLVQVMVDDGPGAAFRWVLHTADAHGLYARFGFEPADHTVLQRRSTQG